MEVVVEQALKCLPNYKDRKTAINPVVEDFKKFPESSTYDRRTRLITPRNAPKMITKVLHELLLTTIIIEPAAEDDNSSCNVALKEGDRKLDLEKVYEKAKKAGKKNTFSVFMAIILIQGYAPYAWGSIDEEIHEKDNSRLCSFLADAHPYNYPEKIEEFIMTFQQHAEKIPPKDLAAAQEACRDYYIQKSDDQEEHFLFEKDLFANKLIRFAS